MQTTVGHNVCNAVTYTRLRSFPWNLPEAHQPLKTWGISIILGPSIHTHTHESSARYIVRLLKLGPTIKFLQSIFQGVLRSSCVEEQHAWKIFNLANHQGCLVVSKFVLVGNWSQSAKICNKEAQHAGRWVRYEALSQGLYGIMLFVMKGWWLTAHLSKLPVYPNWNSVKPFQTLCRMSGQKV